MRKQIKSWIEANATDNVKVLEIEPILYFVPPLALIPFVASE